MPDLRAGAALVIAGLAAQGVSVLEDIVYIKRGYEDFAEKLTSLGGIYFKYVSICTICSLFNNIYKIINEQNILESKVAIAAPLTDIFKIKIKR